MARRFIIGGNWKCNPATVATVKELCSAFKAQSFDTSKVDVVICPSTLHGPATLAGLSNSGIQVGIQNISKTGLGAFTGEATAAMAVEIGYTWCLIGHSERRALFGETVEDTCAKLKNAQEAGLNVIFCIGETLQEREAGTTDKVNQTQLGPALELVQDWDKFVIAYEPVWAIGTGKVATPGQAQQTQAAIRSFVTAQCGDAVGATVRIQYGGSASPENIEGLACKPDIDGFLVGGASLKPAFTKMMAHLSAL